MSTNERGLALYGAVEAKAKESGGVLGTGTFFRTVLEQLVAGAKAQAKAAIDTEEERDVLIEYALKAADAFVAPKFPFGWRYARAGIQSFLDESLDGLPDLLAE